MILVGSRRNGPNSVAQVSAIARRILVRSRTDESESWRSPSMLLRSLELGTRAMGPSSLSIATMEAAGQAARRADHSGLGVPARVNTPPTGPSAKSGQAANVFRVASWLTANRTVRSGPGRESGGNTLRGSSDREVRALLASVSPTISGDAMMRARGSGSGN